MRGAAWREFDGIPRAEPPHAFVLSKGGGHGQRVQACSAIRGTLAIGIPAAGKVHAAVECARNEK
jgi:hypothetical protein